MTSTGQAGQWTVPVDTRTVQEWLQTSELKVQEKVRLSSVSVAVLSSLTVVDLRSEYWH